MSPAKTFSKSVKMQNVREADMNRSDEEESLIHDEGGIADPTSDKAIQLLLEIAADLGRLHTKITFLVNDLLKPNPFDSSS